jgi:enoyl-CoA hydratase/carnithine racemase
MLRSITHDSILELRLDRPPANAFDTALLAVLRERLEAAPGDGFEAIVLSGREGMFSGGLDVPALLELDREGMTELWGEFFAVLRALAGSPVPVAAAVTGHSPAGGAVLTLFCDYRVMAEGAFRIGLNEVQVGLSLAESIYGPLERLVGRRQCERLAVGAELISAAEAHRLGWIDDLAPVDRVVDRALEHLRRLLALPRKAMLATRRVLRSDLRHYLAANEGIEADVVQSWFSEETQTALRALVARLAESARAKKGEGA